MAPPIWWQRACKQGTTYKELKHAGAHRIQRTTVQVNKIHLMLIAAVLENRLPRCTRLCLQCRACSGRIWERFWAADARAQLCGAPWGFTRAREGIPTPLGLLRARRLKTCFGCSPNLSEMEARIMERWSQLQKCCRRCRFFLVFFDFVWAVDYYDRTDSTKR